MATATKRKQPDLWFDYRGERHRIVFIEYRDGRPFSVVTEEHWDHSGEPWFVPGRDKPSGTCAAYWDFEWCKRDGVCYYDQSGGGGDPLECGVSRFAKPTPPPGQLWIAPGVVLTRWVSKVRPNVRIRSAATLLKMGIVLLDRPLVVAGRDMYGQRKRSRNPFLVAEEGDTVYCERCDDWLPCGEWKDPCEHIEWCDRCGRWIYGDTHVSLDSHDGKPTIHDDDQEDR